MLNKISKIIFLASIFALSSNVNAEAIGNFEIAGQNSNYQYWGDSYTPWRGYKFAGSLIDQINDSNSIQFDLKSFNVIDSSGGAYPIFGHTGVVHWVMNYDGYDAGFFTGVLVSNSYYDSGSDQNVFLGVEGRKAVNDWVSLHGLVGVLDQRKGYYEMLGNITFAQASATIFISDQFKIDAFIGHLEGNLGDSTGENADSTTYGLRYEYGFTDAVSVFVEGSGHKDSGDNWGNDPDYDHTTAALGVSYGFGGDSLKARHDNSKSMKAMNFDTISWLRIDGW